MHIGFKIYLTLASIVIKLNIFACVQYDFEE
jgi:hypothetical protein